MSGWTDDAKQRAIDLWNEGKSAAEIAKALGKGFTRNSVLSKIHRSGAAERKAPVGLNARPVRTAQIKRALARAKAAAPTTAPEARPAPKPAPTKAAPLSSPSTHVTSYVAPGQEPAPKVSASAWLPLRGQKPAPFGDPQVCKWPIELPGDPEFYCCGATRDPSESYCEFHRVRSGGPGKPLKTHTFDYRASRTRSAA